MYVKILVYLFGLSNTFSLKGDFKIEAGNIPTNKGRVLAQQGKRTT